MIDKKILDNLDDKTKEAFMQGLESVIERTYDLEKEYKLLNASLLGLQNIIVQIVESQPNPIWILQEDPDNRIFFQNSASREVDLLLQKVDLMQKDQEIEYLKKIYVININKIDTKTIISATDITAQKRSERLASMGQVAAHLAHEIRNPIGAISLMASTLIKRVDKKQKPLVKEIQSSITRVERIIKSTLLFTKGVKITRKPLLLETLSDEIQISYENYGYTKDIELVVNFPTHRYIQADHDLLVIVMQNFLYNAIDAIEEDENESGEIIFDYHKESSFSVITIKDTGVEIKNTNILYEPFQTTKTKGHGLGLALSLEIIKAHNGKIELLQDEKGFKIYIQENSHE